MDDFDVFNAMAEIEARRDEIRRTMRRIERWQNLMIGIVLMGSGVILLAGLFR